MQSNQHRTRAHDTDRESHSHLPTRVPLRADKIIFPDKRGDGGSQKWGGGGEQLMINDLLTAEVAPRRVKYRVRHFGGVFVFGQIPKSQYPSRWLCRKLGVAPQKSLISGSFGTFRAKILLACGEQ